MNNYLSCGARNNAFRIADDKYGARFCRLRNILPAGPKKGKKNRGFARLGFFRIATELLNYDVILGQPVVCAAEGRVGRKSLRFVGFFKINCKDRLFQLFAGLVVQRMGDVFEFTVICLAAGHGNERSVGAFDDLYVVHDKAIVDRDGSNGFQLAVFLFNKSDPHVRNLQKCDLLIRK